MPREGACCFWEVSVCVCVCVCVCVVCWSIIIGILIVGENPGFPPHYVYIFYEYRLFVRYHIQLEHTHDAYMCVYDIF